MSGIYIILFAAFLHLGWVMDLMMSQEQAMATPMAHYYQFFGNNTGILVVLTVVSVMAVWGKIKFHETAWALALLLPQQLLLMISGYSSCEAVYLGHYADMVQRSPHFIFRDQWANIDAVLVHTGYVTVLSAEVFLKKFNNWTMVRIWRDDIKQQEEKLP